MNLTDGVTVLHVVLAVAVLMVGVAALYAPRRLTGVVLFLVFGVFLSSYWAVLGAPDVALAEAVIGTGVTGALFGHVATVLPDPALKNLAPSAPSPGPSRQDPESESDPGTGSGSGPESGAGSGERARARVPVKWGRSVLGVLGGAGLGAGMAYLLTRAATADLPAAGQDGAPAAEAGPGLAEAAAHAMPTTGVEHPITGVLLNLRSYDTLMEMVVLLAAVAVALAFLRDDDAQAAPSAQHQHQHQQGSINSSTQDLEGQQHRHHPSTLVTLYVKVVAPAALLLAAWLLFAGSSQPGGAFQSGAALAAVMILLHTSRLRTFTAGPWMVTVLVVGVIAFLAVALGGLVLGDSWLLLRGPWAGTVTVVLETVLAVSIGANLAVIFMATTVDRSRPSADRCQEVSDA